MHLTVHNADDLRLRFSGPRLASAAWIDLKWKGMGPDAEVTIFVPRERREHYRRAVAAFNAVLVDDTIQEDMPAPEPETEDEEIDF